MKLNLRNIFSGKYLLLVLAIVLFALSFLFNKLYSNRSFVAQEVNRMEKYLARHEKDFNDFVKDTFLVNRLMAREETKTEFSRLAEKPYGIFLYATHDLKESEMMFWSEQLITPPPEILVADDGEYFGSEVVGGWRLEVGGWRLKEY